MTSLIPSPRVLAFDFDGVLADSNAVKRDAYTCIFAQFGDTARLVADGLEKQPDANRYQVISHILDRVRAYGMLPFAEPPGGWVEHLAAAYNDICEEQQSTCPEVLGASAALASLQGRAALYVNSATWEEPLRRVVARRGWERFFRGVYGTPATKADTLRRILAAERATPDELAFVGDGHRDLTAAREVGCRFVGVRNPFNDFDSAGLDMIDDLTVLLGRLGLTPGAGSLYAGKSVLVVVPARGGSKGVKLKNLHPLLGKPLLAHTGELLRELPFVDRAVVSTDHQGIMAVALGCGLEAPFTRPPDLSGDRIGDTDVLIHALQEMDRIDGKLYDVVVMLQPTCPLRRAADVHSTVAKLVDGGWDAVWTVGPTDLKYHPLKQLTVAPDGTMAHFDARGAGVIARQQLQPTYTRNGAAYALTRDCLLGQRTCLPERAAAVVIERPIVSIDTLDDFASVEEFLKERVNS